MVVDVKNRPRIGVVRQLRGLYAARLTRISGCRPDALIEGRLGVWDGYDDEAAGPKGSAAVGNRACHPREGGGPSKARKRIIVAKNGPARFQDRSLAAALSSQRFPRHSRNDRAGTNARQVGEHDLMNIVAGTLRTYGCTVTADRLGFVYGPESERGRSSRTHHSCGGS